jgi:LuxR family maltose regulon positive regulatory protein
MEPLTPPRLTGRQRQVLSLIARGHTNKEIARLLGISQRTVKFHVADLFQRLGTSNRTETLARAFALRLVRPE